MCGRYLLEDEAYADILLILNNLNKEKKIYGDSKLSGMENFTADELTHGEIFPTFTAPVITDGGISAVRWGFPHWKNSSVIINARAETALEKKMFSKPLRERRCVVPSSGFYEWSRGGRVNRGGGSSHSGGGKRKDKYLFRRPGEHTLYMAGIVNTFRDAAGSAYDAFAILTTAANDSVAMIHDRMPVILAPDEQNLWVTDNGFMEFAINRIGQELSHELAG